MRREAVAMRWHAHQSLGPLAVEDALRRLGRQATLLLLDGCAQASSLCSWDVAAQELTDLAALRACSFDGHATRGASWPEAIDGGAIFQADYEFPVGIHAANPPRRAASARAWPLSHALCWDSDGQATLFARDQTTLEQRLRDIQQDPVPLPTAQAQAVHAAWDRKGHRQRVARVQEAIADGECYQINLTLPFHATLEAHPGNDLAVYLRLRADSGGAWSCLLRDQGRSIISHSPECFLQSHDGLVLSRPIKGTRRRHVGNEAASVRALLAASKDNAELAMIVDLVRNDLSRVAIPGGVRVARRPYVVDLPYVHHLVADIEARLREDTHLADLLAAAFPAGSITGAPKIRAMEWIRQLETGPRGPYCGSFGWIGERAECALSVAIRCMVIEGQQVRFDAGGGIVADSDGDAEWDEVLSKAAGMAAALGVDLQSLAD